MSYVSKHRAVWNWLSGCEGFARRFFNFGAAGAGNTIIIPTDSSDGADFIDGTERRTYAVELIRFTPITFDAGDDGNIDMLDAVDAIGQWIEAQAAAGSYPEFPEGCTVTGIDVFDTIAGSAVAVDGLYAKYMLPFSIHYEKTL